MHHPSQHMHRGHCCHHLGGMIPSYVCVILLRRHSFASSHQGLDACACMCLMIVGAAHTASADDAVRCTHCIIKSLLRHYTCPKSLLRHYTCLKSLLRHYTCLKLLLRHYSCLKSMLRPYTCLKSLLRHYTCFRFPSTCECVDVACGVLSRGSTKLDYIRSHVCICVFE